MATRRRKVTPALLAESSTLVRSIEGQVTVLTAWHPSSMALAIITQQLAALAGELAIQKPDSSSNEPTGAPADHA
jgi:hypothetical protein